MHKPYWLLAWVGLVSSCDAPRRAFGPMLQNMHDEECRSAPDALANKLYIRAPSEAQTFLVETVSLSPLWFQKESDG